MKQVLLDQLHDAANEVQRIRDGLSELRAKHTANINGTVRLIGIEPRIYYETERSALAALDIATRTFHSRLAAWAEGQ